METNVNYTLVGFFIIILFIVTVISVIWLATGLQTDRYSYYMIYMEEPVSGLSPDEPVEFNGVAVGKIKDIKINKRNPALVELLIRIKSSTPVTQGTRATLSLRGLTGITYISLEDKGIDKRPLEEPEEGYAIIKTKPSILIKMDTLLTRLSGSFGKLTSSLDEIRNGFTRISNSITSLLNQENLTSVKKILRSGQSSLQAVEIQTIPSVTQTINNLDKLTHDLSETVTEIKQNPSVIIRGKQPQPLGPGE